MMAKHAVKEEALQEENTYQATDDDLPEILQPQNGEPPKIPPKNIASAPGEDDARPRAVTKTTRVTATPGVDREIIEKFLRSGDLKELSIEQRLSYYMETCKSLGLNPLTRPFDFIALNGKLVMYAKRDCTDQLRKIYSVSITSLETKREDGIYIVTAHATDGRGRVDAATGAVSVDGLRGNELANGMMKAETKAKRRVTLSLCGLGMLDESEIESERAVAVVSAPARGIEKPVCAEVPATPVNAVKKAEQPPVAQIPNEPLSDNGAYAPLPSEAKDSERVSAVENFCFGRTQSDDRTIRYLIFCVPSMLSGPFDFERNGKMETKKWGEVVKGLQDRTERIRFIEGQAKELGREAFIQWARAMVESARLRGVFGK